MKYSLIVILMLFTGCSNMEPDATNDEKYIEAPTCRRIDGSDTWQSGLFALEACIEKIDPKIFEY